MQSKNKNRIALSALVVSIISLGYTIYSGYIQNKRITDMTFSTQGLQNRPILNVIGQPEVKRIEYTATVGLLDNKVLETKLKIGTKIKVRNDGNSIAKILCYAVTDRLSGDSEMREILLDKDKFAKFSVELNKEYYKVLDILPGKEHTFEVSKLIENVKDGSFTIHYFVLYKNEGENVYDTYYWARFSSKTFSINPADDDAINKNKIRDSIALVDDRQSHGIYSKEESLSLRDMNKSFHDSFKKMSNTRCSEIEPHGAFGAG